MVTGQGIDMRNVFEGRNDATNFTAHLIRLIAKADRRHKELLRRVFPNAVRSVEHYQVTGEVLDLEYD